MRQGTPIRYVGTSPELAGKVGTFAELQDYDLYDGGRRGWVAGFVDSDGNAFYVDWNEIEAI